MSTVAMRIVRFERAITGKRSVARAAAISHERPALRAARSPAVVERKSEVATRAVDDAVVGLGKHDRIAVGGRERQHQHFARLEPATIDRGLLDDHSAKCPAATSIPE
jgi:hypothetical protein